MKFLILLALSFLLTACKIPDSLGVASPTPAPQVPGSSDGALLDGQYQCYDQQSTLYPQSFRAVLQNAIVDYIAHHKADFDSNDCILNPANWNAYYFGVVSVLNSSGVESIVDDCGGKGICGEIAVKNSGVKKGEGFSDQYFILSSRGCVTQEGTNNRYRGRCIPAWFDR